MISDHLEFRVDDGDDVFVERSRIVVAFRRCLRGIGGVDVDDAHIRDDEFSDVRVARGMKDVFGAVAGIFGGLGEGDLYERLSVKTSSTVLPQRSVR